jgi:hypothetical protein
VTLASPKEWDPSVIDSSVTAQWYTDQKKDLKLLQQGILTEDGKLKEDDSSDNDGTWDSDMKGTDRSKHYTWISCGNDQG